MFDETFLKRLKSWDGKQETWKVWIFKFKNQMKIKDKQFWEILDKTEQRDEEWNATETFGMNDLDKKNQ